MQTHGREALGWSESGEPVAARVIMERQRKYNTAPGRLKKRDVPTVWDLFALDDRANPPNDDDDASSVSSATRAPSIASFASEETVQSDGLPPNVEDLLLRNFFSYYGEVTRTVYLT